MSYILEAMRKSERDRTLGATKTLPPAAGGRKPPGKQWLLVFSAGLLLLLIVGGGWVARSYWPLISMALRSQEAAPATPTEAAPATAPDQTQVITITPTPEPGPEPAPIPRPLVTADKEQQPRSLVTVAEAKEWHELPMVADVADKLPENLIQLRFGIHIYDDNPKKRMLVINGRPYREGDRLPQDANLIEITPSGAVLEYKNSRFHKRN